jgi:hypothetical protein
MLLMAAKYTRYGVSISQTKNPLRLFSLRGFYRKYLQRRLYDFRSEIISPLTSPIPSKEVRLLCLQ